jgi:hypothetical protein
VDAEAAGAGVPAAAGAAPEHSSQVAMAVTASRMPLPGRMYGLLMVGVW